MTPFSTEAGALGRLLDWLQVRLQAQHEPDGLTASDLELMACDLGVTQADLRDVLPRAEDNSLLMGGMMRARDLNPDQVRRQVAALVRDMELTCTRCSAARQCRRDLAAGTAAEHCHEYCGSAETFDDLLGTHG
jgi:hypothetical protein